MRLCPVSLNILYSSINNERRITMRTTLHILLLPAAIVLITGCAPTRLTDLDRTANQSILASMLGSPASKMRVVSQGDRLRLQVSFGPSEVCEGEFNLTREAKGYTVLVYTRYAHLIYDGKWNSSNSAACNMLLGESPEKATRVLVSDGSNRWVTVCLGSRGPLNCSPGPQYRFDEQ